MNGHLKHHSCVILSASRRKATAEVEENGQCAFTHHSYVILSAVPVSRDEVEERGQCAALPGGALFCSGALRGL